jgi:hypothetical protein
MFSHDCSSFNVIHLGGCVRNGAARRQSVSELFSCAARFAAGSVGKNCMGPNADSRELLDRDRDIRNLIGARNLDIAEIYDVGQSGDTQKPFGRVFYTKDKSLIFDGYDLDQQPGIKKAAAFQAWGGRGADRQHAVSLVSFIRMM